MTADDSNFLEMILEVPSSFDATRIKASRQQHCLAFGSGPWLCADLSHKSLLLPLCHLHYPQTGFDESASRCRIVTVDFQGCP
jgi:hypothetical protein